MAHKVLVRVMARELLSVCVRMGGGCGAVHVVILWAQLKAMPSGPSSRPCLTIPLLRVWFQGWDKTYCLQFVENDFDEIHFFGDKTFPVSTQAPAAPETQLQPCCITSLVMCVNVVRSLIQPTCLVTHATIVNGATQQLPPLPDAVAKVLSKGLSLRQGPLP